MNEELRDLRVKNNLRVQDMADLVGISKSYYSLIERGERRVSYDLAFRIANVFKLKPDDIFLDFQLTISKQKEAAT